MPIFLPPPPFVLGWDVSGVVAATGMGVTLYKPGDEVWLAAGQRVLIHAAAGGVGHLAVQIAKAQGAHVTGTASAGNHELLRGLGADELIDYRDADFAEAVRDVDVVLDCFGGDYPARSLPVLRRGGALISLLPIPAPVTSRPRSRWPTRPGRTRSARPSTWPESSC